MRKRILDQPIDIVSMDEAVYLTKTALINSKQFRIITLNSEMVVNATENFEFQAAINNTNLLVPDSVGIVWALKLLNNGFFENLERIPGIELAEKILEAANELSKKVAIFGGTKEVLEKTVVVINKKYPNLHIVKAIDGYQTKEKNSEIASSIASENPELVIVALGTPKQEVWINKYSYLFPKSVMIGVGGSLDVWSGKKVRAPEWIRKSHLEWLFRVLNDPRRIPRVINTLPRFIYMVLKAKLDRDSCHSERKQRIS